MSEGDPQMEEAKERSNATDGEEEESLAVQKEMQEPDATVQEESTLPFDPDLLKGFPPEVKQRVTKMMGIEMRGMSGPVPNPLMEAIAKVMDGGHLTTLIESMDRTAKLEFESAKHLRWICLIVLCVLLAFSAVAIWLLKDSNPDLLKELITIAATLAGGLGMGLGVKTWWDQRQQRM